MANTKEIQKRMKSIRDTMKITSAMYMISSAKLRSAKQKLEQTEPYFYALQGSISRFLRHIPEVQNRYFDQKKEIPEEEKRRGYIVITAPSSPARSVIFSSVYSFSFPTVLSPFESSTSTSCPTNFFA